MRLKLSGAFFYLTVDRQYKFLRRIEERDARDRTDGRSDAPTTVVGRVQTHLHSSLSRACVCGSRDTRRSPVVEPGRGEDDVSRPRVTPPFCVLC